MTLRHVLSIWPVCSAQCKKRPTLGCCPRPRRYNNAGAATTPTVAENDDLKEENENNQSYIRKNSAVRKRYDRRLLKNCRGIKGKIHIERLKIKAAAASPVEVTCRDGFDILCSYNWLKSKKPCIYVPGGASRLILEEKKLPLSVAKDKGWYLMDENALRSPLHQFEPSFRALDIMKPDFTFDDVDLVANRTSLRRLYLFLAGKYKWSFRVDLRVVANTLFMNRYERNPICRENGGLTGGFGHNFEREITRAFPGLEDSSGHHRVISYRMGNLNCVVRFEVDVQLNEQGHMTGPKANETTTPADNNLSSNVTAGDGKDQYKTANDGGPVEVIQLGEHIPSAKIAEIKTKASVQQVRTPNVMCQLWFGRTTNVIHGRHSNGKFVKIMNMDLTESLMKWEADNQENLQRLVFLISKLRIIASRCNGGSCILVYDSKEPDYLTIHDTSSQIQPIPDEFISRRWKETKFEHAATTTTSRGHGHVRGSSNAQARHHHRTKNNRREDYYFRKIYSGGTQSQSQVSQQQTNEEKPTG